MVQMVEMSVSLRAVAQEVAAICCLKSVEQVAIAEAALSEIGASHRIITGHTYFKRKARLTVEILTRRK